MLLRKEALSVAKAASNDTSRYGITGLHIHANGTTEATDGHIAIRFTPACTPGQDEYPTIDGFSPVPLVGDIYMEEPLTPFILPASDALAVAKMPKAKCCLPVLNYIALDVPRTNANGAAYFATTDLDTVKQSSPKKMDAQFPNIDQVLPDKHEAKVTIGFTLSVLEKALDTMKACGVTTFTMAVRDALSPIRLDSLSMSDGQGQVTGAVMPCRIPGKE